MQPGDLAVDATLDVVTQEQLKQLQLDKQDALLSECCCSKWHIRIIVQYSLSLFDVQGKTLMRRSDARVRWSDYYRLSNTLHYGAVNQ